jgi:hypothetical protein
MDPYVVTSMIAETTILWKPWEPQQAPLRQNSVGGILCKGPWKDLCQWDGCLSICLPLYLRQQVSSLLCLLALWFIGPRKGLYRFLLWCNADHISRCYQILSNLNKTLAGW